MTSRTARHRSQRHEKKIKLYKLSNRIAKFYMYFFILSLFFWVLSQALLPRLGLALHLNLVEEITSAEFAALFVTFLVSGLISVLAEGQMKHPSETVLKDEGKSFIH